MANFKCPKTGKEFTIAEYTTKFPEGKATYFDKYGKQIINPDNGEPLISIPKNNGFCTTFGSSKAESYQKMQDHLKQRSKDHYQKEVKYNRRKAGDALGESTSKHIKKK